ncbi:MAG: discoidin domain-containing protein [Syntrophobacteraceae bacterium]
MFTDKLKEQRHRTFLPLVLSLIFVTVFPLQAFSRPEARPIRPVSNAFFEHLARHARRGLYPRGFSGQQPYWTLVGVDGGGGGSALLSEDGAVEPHKGGFSVEPFLIVDGRLLTWADVASSQGLKEGYLPMPSVTWKTPGWSLHIKTFASGTPARSRLHVSYTVENEGKTSESVTLALAVRPFQVDPPAQFLNSPGGFSPIQTIAWNGKAVVVNGAPRLYPLEAPNKFSAAGFTSGDIVARLEAGRVPKAEKASSKSCCASGAMLFRLSVAPHGRETIHLLAPLSGSFEAPEAALLHSAAWTALARSRVEEFWRARLNSVAVHLPRSARPIEDTLRTSLAYILISRNGPALQPGTRSYARTWIRDGAMMSEALLRMGDVDAVRSFINWYARYQYGSGKAPCCVDRRGADPTPENDSNGEFIFTVAQLYRFSHDKAGLKKLWPHVIQAAEYMDRLQARESTPKNLCPERRSFFGLLPKSISHEGYCKKPMHSYWDDFWALQGYDDALYLARSLDKGAEAEKIGGSRNRFRKDLAASVRLAIKLHRIDYVPGCAELGDFDPTSTTIALSPTGAWRILPKKLLRDTFELYWQKFLARLNGKKPWKDYTPYEIRNIDAFTRLGWRSRVQTLLDFFMKGRRPAAWNGWAEVVRRDRRKPGFIGDMPHAWIASDFIRSVLDMLAYRRSSDNSMVLAAGVPPAWLEGAGVGVSGLRTEWGRLDYSLRQTGDRVRLHIEASALPPGGFVLPWPFAGSPGKTVINGREAHWTNGELHIYATHANVTIAGNTLSREAAKARS